MKAVLRAELRLFLGTTAGVTISIICWRLGHQRSAMDLTDASGIVVGCAAAYFAFRLIIGFEASGNTPAPIRTKVNQRDFCGCNS
jgi:hypothetical protein